MSSAPITCLFAASLIAGMACNSVVREDDDDSDGDGGAGANHSSSTGEVPEIETCRELCQLICPRDNGDCSVVNICQLADEAYFMSIGCYEQARALWECGFANRNCDKSSPDCCGQECQDEAIGRAYEICVHNAGGVTGATVSASASSGGM